MQFLTKVDPSRRRPSTTSLSTPMAVPSSTQAFTMGPRLALFFLVAYAILLISGLAAVLAAPCETASLARQNDDQVCINEQTLQVNSPLNVVLFAVYKIIYHTVGAAQQEAAEQMVDFMEIWVGRHGMATRETQGQRDQVLEVLADAGLPRDPPSQPPTPINTPRPDPTPVPFPGVIPFPHLPPPRSGRMNCKAQHRACMSEPSNQAACDECASACIVLGDPTAQDSRAPLWPMEFKIECDKRASNAKHSIGRPNL